MKKIKIWFIKFNEFMVTVDYHIQKIQMRSGFGKF